MNTMTHPSRQQGSMLLEALIAILVFSMGILAIVGLQATSVKLSTDAKFRSEASLLANQYIGAMWASDRTPATLLANFQGGLGTDSAQYLAWRAAVENAQTGLPGTVANPPTVAVVTIPPVSPAISFSSQVTITIFWQAPGETTVHNFVAVARIA
ncbi:MAG: pilus assembly protein PilV [Nitrosomonadales bacterium]|nr:pilus assembly protein PilV [Nitrosomonadales bacterium]